MNIRVILISQDGPARRAYLEALNKTGVLVDVVSSFGEISKFLSENQYNGVMVDLRTKMKTSGREKDLAGNILEQVPFVHLQFEEDTGTIRSLSYGPKGSQTLEEFIDRECRSFSARRIRINARKDIYFNVVLSGASDLSEKASEHTVTINVSVGGCFIYSTGNWEVSDKVMIVIKELEDKRPITCEVRWKRTWGEAMKVPGIGVKFEDISEGQLRDFCEKGSISYQM